MSVELPRNCPRCRIELAENRIGKVVIDYCHSCRGLWLDKGELGDIIKSKPKFAIARAEDDLFEQLDSLYCPVCRLEMKKVHFAGDSGVMVDRCTDDHGIWLDRYELNRILHHVHLSDQLTTFLNSSGKGLKADDLIITEDDEGVRPWVLGLVSALLGVVAWSFLDSVHSIPFTMALGMSFGLIDGLVSGRVIARSLYGALMTPVFLVLTGTLENYLFSGLWVAVVSGAAVGGLYAMTRQYFDIVYRRMIKWFR